MNAAKQILVVDDSLVDRALVTRLLNQVPEWQVSTAADGREAWGLLEQGPPDVIVTDLQMPHLDGLGLVNAVKSRFPNLPVILMTGQGSEEIAAESLRAGATSYTPKSFLQKDLVRTVAYVLDLANHVAHASVTNRSAFQQRFVLKNDCRLVIPLIEHLQNCMPLWSENHRLQFGMAVGEALVNAMHHGNLEVSSVLRDDDDSEYYRRIEGRQLESPYCDRRVQVHAEFDQNVLKIQIEDEGPGFDPQIVGDPTLPENVNKLSGRGLLLIRSFMDQVQHNAVGNHITLIKHRQRPASPEPRPHVDP